MLIFRYFTGPYEFNVNGTGISLDSTSDGHGGEDARRCKLASGVVQRFHRLGREKRREKWPRTYINIVFSPLRHCLSTKSVGGGGGGGRVYVPAKPSRRR